MQKSTKKLRPDEKIFLIKEALFVQHRSTKTAIKNQVDGCSKTKNNEVEKLQRESRDVIWTPVDRD